MEPSEQRNLFRRCSPAVCRRCLRSGHAGQRTPLLREGGRMRRTLFLALSAAAALAVAAAPVTTAATSASAANSGPCGTVTAAPTYTHVIWILMENHSFGDIIGNTAQAQ